MRPPRRFASSKSSMDVNSSEPRASAVRLLPALVCDASRALSVVMVALAIMSLAKAKQTLDITEAKQTLDITGLRCNIDRKVQSERATLWASQAITVVDNIKQLPGREDLQLHSFHPPHQHHHHHCASTQRQWRCPTSTGPCSDLWKTLSTYSYV